MAYSDFTLETAIAKLGISTQLAILFPDLNPVPVPGWLQKTLSKRTPLALISEKSRSEFIVVPVLLASRELSHEKLAIYSGQRLECRPWKRLGWRMRLYPDVISTHSTITIPDNYLG